MINIYGCCRLAIICSFSSGDRVSVMCSCTCPLFLAMSFDCSAKSLQKPQTQKCRNSKKRFLRDSFPPSRFTINSVACLHVICIFITHNLFTDPIFFKAGAQAQFGTVHQNPKVRRSYVKFLTNLLAVHPVEVFHAKYSTLNIF